MNIRTWLGAVGVVALAAGNFGCGGDDDGGGGSVSGSKKVSDLTRDEQITLCKEQAPNVVTLANAGDQINCTADGLSAGDDCEDVRKDCIDGLDGYTVASERESCEDDDDDEGLDGCSATVSEVKACISAWVKKVDTLSDKLTCDTSQDDLADLDFETRPAACEKILNTCPEVADLFGQ